VTPILRSLACLSGRNQSDGASEEEAVQEGFSQHAKLPLAVQAKQLEAGLLLQMVFVHRAALLRAGGVCVGPGHDKWCERPDACGYMYDQECPMGDTSFLHILVLFTWVSLVCKAVFFYIIMLVFRRFSNYRTKDFASASCLDRWLGWSCKSIPPFLKLLHVIQGLSLAMSQCLSLAQFCVQSWQDNLDSKDFNMVKNCRMYHTWCTDAKTGAERSSCGGATTRPSSKAAASTAAHRERNSPRLNMCMGETQNVYAGGVSSCLRSYPGVRLAGRHIGGWDGIVKSSCAEAQRASDGKSTHSRRAGASPAAEQRHRTGRWGRRKRRQGSRPTSQLALSVCEPVCSLVHDQVGPSNIRRHRHEALRQDRCSLLPARRRKLVGVGVCACFRRTVVAFLFFVCQPNEWWLKKVLKALGPP